MPTHTILPGLLLGAVLAGAAAQAAPPHGPQQYYRPKALLPFTPGQGSGVAMTINERGEVCGFSSGPTGAFCYRNGAVVDVLPLPGDNYVVALGINDKGQAVGVSQNTAVSRMRAVLIINGAASELPLSAYPQSEAVGINNGGDIVGSHTDASGATVAFLYRNGKVHDLGTLGTTVRNSGAADINNGGLVVGTSLTDIPTTGYFVGRAFTWCHGQMSALPIPAGYGSVGARVNERGQVVGRIEGIDAGYESWRAVLWDKGRVKVLLDEASDARGINNRGQVVGATLSRTGGFLYEPGKRTRRLNELIKPGNGWDIIYAQDINDRGQIVGYGCREGLCGPVLLDPPGKDD